MAEKMAGHFQSHHRQGQGEPDPEPPAHIKEFRVGLIRQADGLGLQRHAADRAVAGADLAHLCESASENALMDSVGSGQVRMIGMRAAVSARTVPLEVRPMNGAVSRPVR